MQNLRHSSLQIAFMYMHFKFQEFSWNINRDILVQKILGKNQSFKVSLPQYLQQRIDLCTFNTIKVTHNTCSLHLASLFQNQTSHMFYMVY